MRLRRVLFATSLLPAAIAGTRALALPLHIGGCAQTADAAIRAFARGTQNAAETHGVRVESVRTDAVRHTRWAIVASCENTALPRQAVALPESLQLSEPTLALASLSTSSPVIHAGDAVTLLRREGDSSMQLRGIALESAAVGFPIHIRPSIHLGDGPAPVILCRVLHPGIVEVQP